LRWIKYDFEKAKEISMKNLVDAFDNQLSRGQIKLEQLSK
jgi:hypothetical protein